MSRYKAYEEYKDSGIGWLGLVPMNWSVSKVKYLTAFQVGWTPPTTDDANFEGENLWANISDLRGREIFDTNKKISDSAAKKASMDITPQGSLMYSFKLSVGSVSFAGIDMYTNEAIASFLAKSKMPLAYLYYALPKFVIENASTNIYGARILNQELISNADLLAPSFEEAMTIANFLDHETSKIDAVIARQQRLINLLKEKREAVISHAVTKGLNPNAPMRDSDVEWLGDVPAHWVVSKFKYLVAQSSAGPYGSSLTKSMYTSSGVRVYGQQQVIPDDFSIGDYYISEDKFESMRRYEVFPEDVLISVMGTVGKVAVVPYGIERGIINPRLVKYKIQKNKVLPQFVKASISSDVSQSQLLFAAQGSTMDGLNMQILGELPIAFPTLDEQEKILEEISRQEVKFSLLLVKVQRTVDLLSERRTALISAAVTGKIDVRDWQLVPTAECEDVVIEAACT